MTAAPNTRAARGDAARAGVKESAARAHSQLLFREVNEQIRRLASVEQRFDFMCECGHGDCSIRVSLSLEVYENVRLFPTRFLVVPGHAGPDDRVVSESDEWAVVEKVGPAAETAILLDPRKRLRGEDTE